MQLVEKTPCDVIFKDADIPADLEGVIKGRIVLPTGPHAGYVMSRLPTLPGQSGLWQREVEQARQLLATATAAKAPAQASLAQAKQTLIAREEAHALLVCLLHSQINQVHHPSACKHARALPFFYSLPFYINCFQLTNPDHRPVDAQRVLLKASRDRINLSTVAAAKHAKALQSVKSSITNARKMVCIWVVC